MPDAQPFRRLRRAGLAGLGGRRPALAMALLHPTSFHAAAATSAATSGRELGLGSRGKQQAGEQGKKARLGHGL